MSAPALVGEGTGDGVGGTVGMGDGAGGAVGMIDGASVGEADSVG